MYDEYVQVASKFDQLQKEANVLFLFYIMEQVHCLPFVSTSTHIVSSVCLRNAPFRCMTLRHCLLVLRRFEEKTILRYIEIRLSIDAAW